MNYFEMLANTLNNLGTIINWLVNIVVIFALIIPYIARLNYKFKHRNDIGLVRGGQALESKTQIIKLFGNPNTDEKEISKVINSTLCEIQKKHSKIITTKLVKLNNSQLLFSIIYIAHNGEKSYTIY